MLTTFYLLYYTRYDRESSLEMLRRVPAIARKMLGTIHGINSGMMLRRHVCALAEDKGIDHQTLLQLVHQGQFEPVLLAWEREKELNRADPALYTVVMAMCERLKSAELAVAVKEDMDLQKWGMELDCSVHYVKSLLSENRAEEAGQFLKSTYDPSKKEAGALILQCARAFQDGGHVTEALMSCDLHSCSEGGRIVALDCVKVECLGEMQATKQLLEFVTTNYGSASSQHPVEFQAALINALSLANELGMALDRVQEYSNPTGGVLWPKNLALLLESAGRAHDYKAAAFIYQEIWKGCSQLTNERLKETSLERLTYLVRAANAAIRLQASGRLSHPEVRTNSAALSKREKSALADFMNEDFYQFILDESLLPDSDTLESLLLLSVFEVRARESVEKVLRVLVRNGETPRPRAFTRWATQCGRVQATRIRKVIQHVRMLVHGYSVPLGHVECADLLGLAYVTHSEEQRLEAAKNVRIIKRIMDKNDLLSETHGWNILLSGFLKTSFIKAVYFTLEDIAERGLKPNLETFKILTNGLNSMGKHYTYTLAIYDFWREFTKLYPAVRPDVEYINKLLLSCRKCRHVERALFFLGVAEQCGLKPDLATFRELLVMCSECEEKQRFDALLTMAHKFLPQQRANLDAIVADCQLKWKAEVDGELASTIIFASQAKRTSEEKTSDTAE